MAFVIIDAPLHTENQSDLWLSLTLTYLCDAVSIDHTKWEIRPEMESKTSQVLDVYSCFEERSTVAKIIS